jgi:hypothetical protein
MVKVHSFWRMGWHGGSEDLIDPSILAYGWHGGHLQEWYTSIHFGVWRGTAAAKLLFVRHFGIWVTWRSRARMVYDHPFLAYV